MPGQGLPQVGAHGHPGLARESRTSLQGDGAEWKMLSKDWGLGFHSPGGETVLLDRLYDQQAERGSPWGMSRVESGRKEGGRGDG